MSRPAARLAPTWTRPHARFRLQEVVFTTSTFLIALSGCNVTVSVSITEELVWGNLKWLLNARVVYHRQCRANCGEVGLRIRRQETSVACCPSQLEATFSSCGVCVEKRLFIWEFSLEFVPKSSLICHFSAAKHKKTPFVFQGVFEKKNKKRAAPDLWRCHSSVYIHSGPTG